MALLVCTNLCCCCVSGSDNDRKQKSNATVSAGWPLTGFAVFILLVTEASETHHMDRHLPEPTHNHPASASASPRPPTNSPRSTLGNTTSSTGMSVPAGPSSPSSAVSGVPSATDLQALPSSVDLIDSNPKPLWASHPQQSTVTHVKKRKWSEEDSLHEQQQQQWHEPQEGHVTKAAVNLVPAGQTGEVVVTGVGLAAAYYRSAHLQR